MDSYIVRVYRRERGSSGDEIAGLVEEVGTDQRTSFQTFSGLVTTIRRVVGRDTSHHSNVCDLNADIAAAKSSK